MEYPNANEHLREATKQALHRYVDGAEQAGLKPSARLERAVVDRAYRIAKEDYEDRCAEVFVHNIDAIVSGHKQRDKEIKRYGARQALIFCPFAILAFGLCAWISRFDAPMCAINASAATAFLLLLVIAVRQVTK